VNLDAFFKDIKGLGIGEIFLNSVSQDGTMNGYDYNLIKKVTSKINLPVIAAGGCGDKGDCVKAINYGANAVAAGSIFFWVGESVISVKKYMAHKNLNVRLI
jgi:cyclase